MAKAAARAYTITPGIKPGGSTVLSEVVANSSQSAQACTKTSPQDSEANQNIEHHGVLTRREKQDTCKACQASRRFASKNARREVLGEIQTNAAKPRVRRTNYYCDQCLIALCNGDLCWEEHLAAYLGDS